MYIEYYKGFKTTPEGKIKYIREFEYLNLYLTDDPQTSFERKKNKEQLKLAEQIFVIRKAEILQGKYKIQNTHKVIF